MSDPPTDPAPMRDSTPEPARPAASSTFGASSSSFETRASSLSDDPPQRRGGGIGLFTATALSTVAALAGAYLALFLQARPDVLQSVGLSGIVPRPADAASEASKAMADRLGVVERQLAVLERRIAALPQPAPAPSAAPGQVPPASGVTPPVPGRIPETTRPAPNAVAPAPAVPAPGGTPAVPPVVAGVTATQLAALEGRVTGIETRLAALDPTGAGGAVIAGLQTEIATLKVLVEQLRSQASTAPSPAVTLAVVALTEAAGRSGPFLSEFEAARAAMPGATQITELADLARTGAPTRALLEERFKALPAAVAEAEQASQDTGFVGWLRGLMANLIQVEEPVTTEGSSSSARLERARLKLEQGDLAGAAEEVGAIAPQGDAVRAWLAGANARLDLERKLAGLRGAVESGAWRTATAIPPVGPDALPARTPPPTVIPALPPTGGAQPATAPLPPPSNPPAPSLPQDATP